MSNEQQPSASEQVSMTMFGILYSVCAHQNTPLTTKRAIIQTLGQVLNDENGPFQQDDAMNEMGAVFADAMNKLIPSLRGEAMLADMFSKSENWN